MGQLKIRFTEQIDTPALFILQQARLGPAKMILEWFTGKQVPGNHSVKLWVCWNLRNNGQDKGDVIVHEPYDTHSMITKVGYSKIKLTDSIIWLVLILSHSDTFVYFVSPQESSVLVCWVNSGNVYGEYFFTEEK